MDAYYTFLPEPVQDTRERSERQMWRDLGRLERQKKFGPLICPQCGGQTGRRMGFLERAISVELFGLASSKIGKQYKCGRCGHLW